MLSVLKVLLHTCNSQESLRNAIMKTENFQDLQSACWRLRRADGIVSIQVQGFREPGEPTV